MKNQENKLAKKFMSMNIFFLYLIMLAINIVCVESATIVFLFCGFKFSQHVASLFQLLSNLIILPLAAHFEEILFRWIPMLITVAIVKSIVLKSNQTKKLEYLKKKWMLIVLLITSIIFGYIHGNIFNVFIQGFSGLIFSAIYFRAYFRCNPNKSITNSQLIPLASATIFHSLSNSILIFI